MEIQNIYITDDIIDNIFNNLSYHSKINFSQTTHYMYNKYYGVKNLYNTQNENHVHFLNLMFLRIYIFSTKF